MASTAISSSSQHHSNPSNTLSITSTAAGSTFRKASFANLAKFFGLGGSISAHDAPGNVHQVEVDDEEDDQDGEMEIDEESLMWDAQVGA
jgi:hypothetical protein